MAQMYKNSKGKKNYLLYIGGFIVAVIGAYFFIPKFKEFVHALVKKKVA